jgi:2',3'-cyclic-nucleotide 2'-phosphodiesterase/3'-nucleotidase
MAGKRLRARGAIGALGTVGALSAIGITACSSSVDTPAPQVANGTTATLALLETTDIHTNLLSYDYYKLAEDKSLGLERTATLIAAARKEFPNTLLLDDGDTIQGTALADYQAQVAPVDC